jgi:pimeloyl-ACP methyl ester carboxylesterase
MPRILPDAIELPFVDAIAGLRIPIWREGRLAAEHAGLRRSPVLRGDGLPRGNGAPVLLIPGFMAGEASLGMMARWLRDLGYRPCRPRIRVNVDCTERAVQRLLGEVEGIAARHGRRVSVVGHSRGGSMARVLAVRRPDLIERIVCLGSPLTDEFAVHPLVRAQVRAVALLGSLGVPGVFSYGCRDGCCSQARSDLHGGFPAGVDFTSVYSRSDGVVSWRACLDPAARAVEVDSSHVGMAMNAAVFRAIGEALGRAAVPVSAPRPGASRDAADPLAA